MKDAPEVAVDSRAELRRWLADNHADSASVWLVTGRKGNAGWFPVEERVEELLCWGWIDSVPRKVDDARTAVLISPRKASSAWSGLNKRLVARARDGGAMTAAGEACHRGREEQRDVELP